MVIFLAGVHGVGKTFLGRAAAEKLGLRYATASSLIRDELGGKESWSKSKRTRNVESNQEALISAVLRILEDGDVTLVLDGHFVLRNGAGNLIPIPSDVFKRLRLKSAILLEDPASVVAVRLRERGVHQSLDNISELADAELRNAKHLCEEIGISLTRLVSPSKEEFFSALKEVAEIRE